MVLPFPGTRDFKAQRFEDVLLEILVERQVGRSFHAETGEIDTHLIGKSVAFKIVQMVRSCHVPHIANPPQAGAQEAGLSRSDVRKIHHNRLACCGHEVHCGKKYTRIRLIAGH
jgi:hypothetical protein